jgi:transposase-like protein
MRNDSSDDIVRLRSEVATRIEPFVKASDDARFEERCRIYLQTLRWPQGVTCPRCEESTRLLRLESRGKWNCYQCRYQFSVTAGTLFHRSHLPVWKWLIAVHLMLDSPDGISAGELRRLLGGSYKTAWFAAHRIRVAMRGRGELLLRSLVEAESDELLTAPAPLGEAQELSLVAVEGGDGEITAALGRRLAGPHLHLSAKHLLAYLDERRWRFVQRGNPHAFRDTIVALLRAEGISYVQLVGER